MIDLSYVRPASLEAALALLANGARPIAGGTEFLNWLRLGIEEPAVVADVGRLPGLDRVELDGDRLRIGALATLNAIGEHAGVQGRAPALAEACLKAASAQLRNRATLGGNLLQRTRCPYFRAEAPGAVALPWPCNKRVAGSGCAGLESGHTRLALFGGSETCVATYPADPPVALVALDAVIRVIGPNGAREIPATSFHLTQAEAAAEGRPLAETRLRADELVVEVIVPLDIAGARSTYLKVRERESYEYAMVSAAASVAMDGARIAVARVALGSVAQKPWRLATAEAALVGRPLEAASIDAALDGAFADAATPRGNEFKVRLARNVAREAILSAGART